MLGHLYFLRIQSNTSDVLTGIWISPMFPLSAITTPHTIFLRYMFNRSSHVGSFYRILKNEFQGIHIARQYSVNTYKMATSNKYIPPAFRNKNRFMTLDEDARAPTPMPKQEEFPVLGGSPRTTSNGWKAKKSFAVLATEWNDHSEEEKTKEEYRRVAEKRESEKRERDMRNMVVFERRSSFDDAYDENTYMMEDAAPATQDTGDWVTIERKARREISEDEKQMREEAREAEERDRNAYEDSVWNASNADEWDYRDRRVNN